MQIKQELLFFFSALGAFNGILLSIYFFFFTKKKYLSGYFLGALLLALSVRISKSILLYFDHSLAKIYLQVGLSACFFIGPLLYYFIKSTVDQVEGPVPKNWRWSLLCLLAITIVVGILFPYQDYPALWGKYFIKTIYTEWFVYIVATGFVLKAQLKKLSGKKETNKMNAAEAWLLSIYFGNVVLLVFYLLAFVNAPFASYIIGSVAFSIILYLVISVLLYRKKTDDLFLLNPPKSAVKKVDEAAADLLIRKLENVMLQDEVYKNPDLKLSDLSQGINISAHQLSQLLNENLEKNFTTFVNEFRINEACRMMASDNRFTLESIGYEVGFNSKSTFFAAFKKLRGTTPLNYQQAILKA